MKPSQQCIDLIKSFEGLSLKAYPDPGTGGSPWTIGYGTTTYRSNGLAKYGRSQVKSGDSLTLKEAEQEKASFIAIIQNRINKEKFSKKLNQNQFDSLISFCYNAGFPPKQMARLREDKFDEYIKFSLLYINKGTPAEAGLRRRRLAEKTLWEKPIDGDKKMSTDQATLTKTGRKYGAEWGGLDEMILSLGDKSWRVASGVPGRQIYRKAGDTHSIPGSLEPIPEGSYSLGEIEWAAGKNNWKASWGNAIGAFWQSLNGSQPMRRGSFGVHMDNNLISSRGSAGCVVFYITTELEEWAEEFEKHKPKKLVVDWNL